jgi:hypothetical protein
MARVSLSRVSHEIFQPVDALGNLLSPLNVGSDAWYAWLRDGHNQSFTYRGERGAFTARCERQRNGRYWYAYRRHGKKVHKVYLGLSERLTTGHLAAAAQTLSEKQAMDISAGAKAAPVSLVDACQTIDDLESTLARRRRLTRHDSERLITLARVVVRELEASRLGEAGGQSPS